MLLKRSLVISFILVAFLGFLDASYLTASHYANIALPCFVVQGCEIVTTSIYSKIFGIPVAVFGVGFYLSALILMFLYVDKKFLWIIKMAIPLITSIGLLASVWFLYVQIFLLRALCMYCLFSATFSTILFLLMIALKYNYIKQTKETN
jgi:uncharacterized membrane protein